MTMPVSTVKYLHARFSIGLTYLHNNPTGAVATNGDVKENFRVRHGY